MKKFSRCALILIIVTILGVIGGYIFESTTTTPMYTSTAKIIVTPGEANEATVRATDGGLVKDFEIVFKSNVVIEAAQKTAGTSENIAQYLTVKTVPNSNIIELTITNPDQTTAKTYVDAIAKNAVKTTNIVAVQSIQVLQYGDESNIVVKPYLYRNTAVIAAVVAAICLIIELIVIFVMNAFKDEDDSDDEMEYERKYGKLLQANLNMLPYDRNIYHSQQGGGQGYPAQSAGYGEKQEEDELYDDSLADEEVAASREPVRHEYVYESASSNPAMDSDVPHAASAEKGYAAAADTTYTAASATVADVLEDSDNYSDGMDSEAPDSDMAYGTPEDTLAETEAAASEVPQSAAEVLKESKGKTMRSSAEVIGIIRK